MSKFDAFLKIDGINGEEEDKEFKDHIGLISYSFGATQTGTMGHGGGGGAGKVQFRDFHFTKWCDDATPELFLACASGKHIPNAELKCRKATGDGGQKVFYKVKFKDLMISSHDVSGTGEGSSIPTESISFNFSELIMEYGKQNAQGQIA